MGKREGKTEERETAAALSEPDEKKRKKTGTGNHAPGAGICADIQLNIFARLPARTAVASTTLSKHHHRLILSPEFRNLHCRLGAPLPCSHIAYLVNGSIKGNPEEKKPISMYHGFHIAGAGLTSNTAPVLAIAGAQYIGKKYINTCNGIVVLASNMFRTPPCRCILWNPALADAMKEVTVPVDPFSEIEYRVLGLGYGRRTKTYKLLLCRDRIHRVERQITKKCRWGYRTVRCNRNLCSDTSSHGYALVIYTLGDADQQQPRLQTLLSDQAIGEIRLGSSLYMDGTIYLPTCNKPLILAVDVDDEIVTTIDLPGGENDDSRSNLHFGLMEMSGRPCVVTHQGTRNTLWLLNSTDHRWEPRYVCVTNISHSALQGIWDCSGLLVMYLQNWPRDDKLRLYDVATDKAFEANLPDNQVPDWSNHTLCWGYRPTLVSPETVVSKLVNHDVELHQDPASMLQPLMPANEQDRKRGRKVTLRSVCFMNFLVGIMEKLPYGMQDVVDTTVDSKRLFLEIAHGVEDEDAHSDEDYEEEDVSLDLVW